jgi:hypothetical protein
MWPLLFYYALLNAVCVSVLLFIAWDPPISEDEDEGMLPPMRAAAGDMAEEPPRHGQATASSRILFDFDRRKAVA